MKQWMLEKNAEQEQNHKLCGRSYNKEYLEYLCVDSMGDIIKPNYISSTFSDILEQNGLSQIPGSDFPAADCIATEPLGDFS